MRNEKKIKDYRCIAVVGGGGKTSLIFYLAKLLAEKGKKVIVATSTHMAKDSCHPFACWGNESLLYDNLSAWGYSVVGVPENTTGKITCPSQPNWEDLLRYCDILLVEADGAHGRPLKVPADFEPVIPEQAELVIGVVGLDALGQSIEKGCHRPELVAALLGQDVQHKITEDDIAVICHSPHGLQKDVGKRAFWIILNKADDERTQKHGDDIRQKILENNPAQPVYVISLKYGNFTF